MATHGYIIVRSTRGGARKTELHTYSDGHDVRHQVMPYVIDLLARRVLDFAFRQKGHTPDFYMALGSWALDGIDYVPTAAALIIAARPFHYAPVTPASRRDLPVWSGRDNPFVLTVDARKDGACVWILKEPGKRTKTYRIGRLVLARARRLVACGYEMGRGGPDDDGGEDCYGSPPATFTGRPPGA